MEIAIGIGQGAGLAIACGLAALLPLGVLALAALLGWTPATLALVDERALLAGAWILGIAEAGVRLRLPIPVRMALSAVAGSATFELAAGGAIPWIGVALGAPLAAVTAWAMGRLADGAVAGGGPIWGVTALMGAAVIVAAALAIIPFVGFALVLASAWLALRTLRGDRERYAGLRVLK